MAHTGGSGLEVALVYDILQAKRPGAQRRVSLLTQQADTFQQSRSKAGVPLLAPVLMSHHP